VIIEIDVFSLRDGVASSQFVELDQRVQAEFFHLQPGLVRRTVARHGSDWLVLTFWGSQEDADGAGGSAIGIAADDGLVESYLAMIDGNTRRTRRFETLE
jgi:hypothetical protein